MNKLILNLSHEFNIENYSRNTSIGEEGKIYTYASISFENTTGYDDLLFLSQSLITDLEITKMDGAAVIHLTNQDARITSIYENLSDNKVYMTATINFGTADNSEPDVQ